MPVGCYEFMPRQERNQAELSGLVSSVLGTSTWGCSGIFKKLPEIAQKKKKGKKTIIYIYLNN